MSEEKQNAESINLVCVSNEVEDCMFCCLGETPVITYILETHSKTLTFYVEPHLDMSKVTMADAVVVKEIDRDKDGYDLEIYCPVCGKPTNHYGHIPFDAKVFSGPDHTLIAIPISEIPKECIVASEGFDLSTNPSTTALDKWFGVKRHD